MTAVMIVGFQSGNPGFPGVTAGQPQWELDALADDEPPPEDEDSWAVGVNPEDLALWLDDGRLAAFYAEAAQVTADAVAARERPAGWA